VGGIECSTTDVDLGSDVRLCGAAVRDGPELLRENCQAGDGTNFRKSLLGRSVDAHNKTYIKSAMFRAQNSGNEPGSEVVADDVPATPPR
jgi:hypothetical protein